jgi:hypothetical protein
MTYREAKEWVDKVVSSRSGALGDWPDLGLVKTAEALMWLLKYLEVIHPILGKSGRKYINGYV